MELQKGKTVNKAKSLHGEIYLLPLQTKFQFLPPRKHTIIILQILGKLLLLIRRIREKLKCERALRTIWQLLNQVVRIVTVTMA